MLQICVQLFVTDYRCMSTKLGVAKMHVHVISAAQYYAAEELKAETICIVKMHLLLKLIVHQIWCTTSIAAENPKT